LWDSCFKKEVKRLEGKIRRLIHERGFGFITAEGGEDVFFHRSALAGEDFGALVEGTSVEFDLERGPKGARAVNVRVGGPLPRQEEGGQEEGGQEEGGQEEGGQEGDGQEGGGLMEAYCLKCRAKREMKDAKAVTMKNGRPATQGVCPTCGTKMFRIGKS